MENECKCTKETVCHWHYQNLITHIDKQAAHLNKIEADDKVFQKSILKFIEKCDETIFAVPKIEEQEKNRKRNLRVHFLGRFLSGLATRNISHPVSCIMEAMDLVDEAIERLEHMESKDA